jgi:hypothetical protein
MPVISAADVQSKKDSHLVFEEIGLMASANDYQLATMKVNLTRLEKQLVWLKRIVTVVNNQGKTMDLINQDLAQIQSQISFDELPKFRVQFPKRSFPAPYRN